MSDVQNIERTVRRVQEKYGLDEDDVSVMTSMLFNLVKSRDRKINTLKRQVRPREFEWNMRDISGALRNCILAHGPITPEWIGSASKRIYTQCQKLPHECSAQTSLDLETEK